MSKFFKVGDKAIFIPNSTEVMILSTVSSENTYRVAYVSDIDLWYIRWFSADASDLIAITDYDVSKIKSKNYKIVIIDIDTDEKHTIGFIKANSIQEAKDLYFNTNWSDK